MRNYSKVLQAFTGTSWAILPDKAHAIASLLELRSAGGYVSANEISDLRAASMPRVRKTSGAVAVIPLLGTLANRAGMITDFSGGTSLDSWGRNFDAAVQDPAIGAIVLDIDSPGGTVAGTPELANKVFAARSVKPIYAVANCLAASAAYWIGTSASQLFASPSAEVGSIGVLFVHEDCSGAAEQQGVKYTIVRAGRFKAESNSYEPLTKDARDALQARADADYEMFVSAVAMNRKTAKRKVVADYGEGRVFGAQEALSRGMIDGIATLDEVIQKAIK